ncbi:AAA family ATPase [Niallia sp. 01092]|uniref:AAA family ATPase n=1 Tax=unclassified Niallia TaxID=2837522 RepID=UPI003FD4277E
MMNQPIKVAISGSYSSGKTTTTEALSALTGINRSYARTMRELLPVYAPGKELEECTIFELYELGIRRFVERAINENNIVGSYVTDGSSIHEYIYGLARLKYDIYMGNNYIKKAISRIAILPYKKVLNGFIDSFGNIVKTYAKDYYDIFIHLPIEFPLVRDGHRPQSETFRSICNDLLLDTIKELGIDYLVVHGSLENRLKQIVDRLNLKCMMSYEEAISIATERTRLSYKVGI